MHSLRKIHILDRLSEIKLSVDVPQLFSQSSTLHRKAFYIDRLFGRFRHVRNNVKQRLNYRTDGEYVRAYSALILEGDNTFLMPTYINSPIQLLLTFCLDNTCQFCKNLH